jgi:hypothetical protein
MTTPNARPLAVVVAFERRCKCGHSSLGHHRILSASTFGWRVGNTHRTPAFFGLGIGLDIATVAALFTRFKKRGWF